MRFVVPSSDLDSDSDTDPDPDPPVSTSVQPSTHRPVSHASHSTRKPTTLVSSGTKKTTSAPSSALPHHHLDDPEASFNDSLPGSLRSSLKKSHKGKRSSGRAYCIGTPVPTSDTTPSPFAVAPPRSKSTSTGFSQPRSSLRLRVDEEPRSGSSSSEGEEDEDGPDSEEEQWPIRRSQTGAETGPAYLVPDHDAVQLWEQRERHSTYQQSMRNAAARRRHFEGIHVRTLARAHEQRARLYEQRMDELSEVLGRIGLDQEREDRLLADGFEKREKERARAFEALIAAAERVEQEEHLRVAMLKQQEAARKAEIERKEALEREEAARKARLAAELKRQQEQEAHEQQLRQKAVDELVAQASDQVKIVKELYEKWHATMQQIKQTVLPNVSSNEKYKALCRQAKRRITPKVGQLTNSSRQIEKVIMELGDVLEETRKNSQDVYLWACNHLSKALIKQAETEVTAKLSTVYPLARVVVGLIVVGYTELGDVLMARLVKKCYFVVAYRPPPLAEQSAEEYRKQLGHAAEGAQESGIQYAGRMGGIVALYAAIMQTDPRDVVPSLRGQVSDEQAQRIPPQLRLDASWCWFAHMLKLPVVKLSPTPQLLTVFIDVAGERMLELYGRQWVKLLEAILGEGIRGQKAEFNWDDCRPTIIQLQAMLEDIERSGVQKLGEGRQYERS